MSVSMLNVGECGIILECRGKDSIKKHLQNLGFLKGEEIKVVSENPSGLILLVKGVRIALNRGLASMIMVRGK